MICYDQYAVQRFPGRTNLHLLCFALVLNRLDLLLNPLTAPNQFVKRKAIMQSYISLPM